MFHSTLPWISKTLFKNKQKRKRWNYTIQPWIQFHISCKISWRHSCLEYSCTRKRIKWKYKRTRTARLYQIEENGKIFWNIVGQQTKKGHPLNLGKKWDKIGHLNLESSNGCYRTPWRLCPQNFGSSLSPALWNHGVSIIVIIIQDGMNIVDVLAIMPFFVTLFMAEPLDVET